MASIKFNVERSIKPACLLSVFGPFGGLHDVLCVGVCVCVCARGGGGSSSKNSGAVIGVATLHHNGPFPTVGRVAELLMAPPTPETKG